MFKHYHIAASEKEMFRKLESGGIEEHRGTLEKLIAGAKDGPEAKRKEDGSIDIRFLTTPTLNELLNYNVSGEDTDRFVSFNAAASRLAQLPQEWALPDASDANRKKYKEAKIAYESERDTLMQKVAARRGEKEATLAMLSIEQRVYINQFMNTHPDVEKRLLDIQSKSAWRNAWKLTLKERSISFGWGLASRSVAVTLLGSAGIGASWVAAPFGGAFVGYIMGRRRGKETIQEEKYGGRRGKEVRRKELMFTPKGTHERSKKDYTDAELLVHRLEDTIRKIQFGGKDKKGRDISPQERSKRLSTILEYAEGKLAHGLVNFGTGQNRLHNQIELMKQIGLGQALLVERGQKIGTMLDTAFEKRAGKIQASDKWRIQKEATKGLVIGASFALGGRAVAEFLHWGGGPKTIEAPSETPVAPPDEGGEIGRAIKEAAGSAEVKSGIQFTQEQLTATARSGDSIWRISEQKLDELFHDKFSDLDPARKTFIIDAVKDEIAKQFENPDKIKIGEHIDFSGILDNKEKMARIFEEANALDDAARENIASANKAIAEWVQAHPGEALTTEKVEEILREMREGTQPVELTGEYAHDAGPLNEPGYFGVDAHEADMYGSKEEALYAKTTGLSSDEYRVLRRVKVGDILKEIPSGKETRAIWEGQIEGKVIGLPYAGGEYDPKEFEGHIRLADILRTYVAGHPHEVLLKDMTVEEFLKTIAPLEGQVRPNAPWHESIADTLQTHSETPEPEQISEISPETPPPDQIVSGTKIEGRDILAYGSAEEAFVAKERLGMSVGEWQEIKFKDTAELLRETPERTGPPLSDKELEDWYVSKKPNLPGRTSFYTFKRYAFLADGLRERLKDHPDREYLEKLPVRELVRNFILAGTPRGSAAEAVRKAAEEITRIDRSPEAP